VPFAHNWLSTSSHLRNLSSTFRASVVCGQSIDSVGQRTILRGFPRSDYESEGREFESLRARHKIDNSPGS
jgi:hypothetical protein